MKFKNIATVPSFFLSLEWTSELNLNEQPLIILLSKSLVKKLGITSDSPKFDVIKNKGVISLVTSVPPAKWMNIPVMDDHIEEE